MIVIQYNTILAQYKLKKWLNGKNWLKFNNKLIIKVAILINDMESSITHR